MENVKFMGEDQFDQKVNELYHEYLEIKDFSLVMKLNLNELTVEHKEHYDSDTYLMLMFLHGKHYELDDQKNAARFCALRMMEVIQGIQGKTKRPKFLKIVSYESRPDMVEFMTTWCAFLKDTYHFIQKRLIMLSIVSGAILAIISVLLGLAVVFAVLEGVVFVALMYFLYFKRLKLQFNRRQINALLEYVDEEVKEFDRPIYYA